MLFKKPSLIVVGISLVWVVQDKIVKSIINYSFLVLKSKHVSGDEKVCKKCLFSFGKWPEFASIKNCRKTDFSIDKKPSWKVLLTKKWKQKSLVIIITPTLFKTEEVFFSSKTLGPADI